MAPGYGEVALPNDCIKTAQIVSVMLVVKNKQRNALYKYKGFPEPQDLYNNSSNGVSGRLVVPIQPGEAYILAHSDELGDFHAATVIAQDEGDNVTMEADACDSEAQPITLEPRHIVFDMYNEQPGREKESFWGTQGAKISDRVFKVSLQRGSGLICDLNFNLGSKKEELLGSIMGFKKPTSVPNQC